MFLSKTALIIVTIIISIALGFPTSLLIISKYLKDSNDYGNDFGEMFDIIQSSMKITEQRDKIKPL